MTDKSIENCALCGFGGMYHLLNRPCVSKNVWMCEICGELNAYLAFFGRFVFQNLEPMWGS